jgi:hypothetical protein
MTKSLQHKLFPDVSLALETIPCARKKAMPRGKMINKTEIINFFLAFLSLKKLTNKNIMYKKAAPNIDK